MTEGPNDGPPRLLRLGPRKRLAAAAWLLTTAAVAVLSRDAALVAVYAFLAGGLALVAYVVMDETRRVAPTVDRRVRRHVGALPSASRTESRNGDLAGTQTVRRREDALWAGFCTAAAAELERLSTDRAVSAAARGEAFLGLARWHGTERRLEQALECAVLARIAHPPMGAGLSQQTCLEADFLTQLGRHDEASDLLGHRVLPGDPNWLLRLANNATEREPDIRLAAFNEVLGAGSYAPVRLIDADRPLRLANLTSTATPADTLRRHDTVVCVIMPVYNAADTLDYALRSVLAQTWEALEVIVVDDASTDATPEVVERIATEDPRVRLLRSPENRGTYASRNAGLEVATGEFVTIHDADDWSHPQKIERQVLALLEDRQLVGTLTQCVRVSTDLHVSSSRPAKKFLRPNTSSFLFRRRIVDAIGNWDEVRTSADNEYIARAAAFYGSASISYLDPSVPLSFALVDEGSLTRHSATGLSSAWHVLGARRQYREAYQRWHASEDFFDDLPWHAPAERRFPRPELLRTRRDGPSKVDVALSVDLSDDLLDLEEELAAYRRQGETVGLIHHPDLETFRRRIRPELFALIDGHWVRLLSSGEHVHAERLIVHHPMGNAPEMDDPPLVETPGTDSNGTPDPVEDLFASRSLH